jgi:Glycerate kinase
VFSPQKGASKKEIEALERALTGLADVAAKEFGFDYRDEAGASAAGELAFGLMSFCGAKIRPGLGGIANYVSGSGGNTLLFERASDSEDEVCVVDLNGGAIIACEASARLRPANLSFAHGEEVTTEL